MWTCNRSVRNKQKTFLKKSHLVLNPIKHFFNYLIYQSYKSPTSFTICLSKSCHSASHSDPQKISKSWSQPGYQHYKGKCPAASSGKRKPINYIQWRSNCRKLSFLFLYFPSIHLFKEIANILLVNI